MNRLVASVFKALMIAIIGVFVFDIVFYVYRAVSLNQRMESVMTSMQKTVMENNYLPEGDYKMYEAIFRQMATDMNKGDVFINGFSINYNRPDRGSLSEIRATRYTQTGSEVTENILKRQMSTPANYGDVMCIEVSVNINMPIWNWGNASPESEYVYSGQAAPEWDRVGYRTNTFKYTYYVPCLKYQSIQEY